MTEKAEVEELRAEISRLQRELLVERARAQRLREQIFALQRAQGGDYVIG